MFFFKQGICNRKFIYWNIFHKMAKENSLDPANN
jgi:hypothetical protein